MSKEAMKQALDFIERVNDCCHDTLDGWIFADFEPQMYAAITTLREALAQPEQEPVAWQLWVGADTPLNDPMGWRFHSAYVFKKNAEVSAQTINNYQQAPFAKLVPLYTIPPQRTWVGLTDEEFQEILKQHDGAGLLAFYNLAEAKLRSKNEKRN